jgi:hypothetical protein
MINKPCYGLTALMSDENQMAFLRSDPGTLFNK